MPWFPDFVAAAALACRETRAAGPGNILVLRAEDR
jgi:hypothetical protein